MVPDLTNVTVLIPAHNRPERLRRLIDYYQRTNIKILVADSSTKRFLYAENYPAIIYKHFPDAQFLWKIYEVLPLIETSYVVYCADDDFIVPEAIAQITTFLDQNEDYTTAQGHFLTFETHKRKIVFSPRYIRNFDKKIDGELALKRLEQYNNLYASILYSICRSEVFKQMYTEVIDSKGKLRFKNLYLAEVYFNLYTLIKGKHITWPVFYAARERIEGSATTTTTPLKIVMTSCEYTREYEGFLSILSSTLAQEDGLQESNAREIIQNLMERTVLAPKSLKMKIIDFVGKHSFTQWISKLLELRYKTKGIKAVKGMESYPYNKITPEKKAIIDAINS